MRKPIPYAGFDPTEYRPPGKRKGGRRREINVERALELKAQGLTYRDIGIKMAEEERRALPYTHDSISSAIGRERRRES